MDQDQKTIVVQQIARHQTRLRALVRCLFVRAADVDDLVQEINCVLWEKSDSYQPGTDFWSWASQIARFKALNQIRKYGRERLVFDDEMLARIASVAERKMIAMDQRRDAMGVGPESIVELVDLLQGDPFANAQRTPVYRPCPQETPRKVLAGVAALAALVFLAFGIFRNGDSGHANAAAIVRAAIDTAGQNVERVYVVEVTKGDAVSPEIARTARVATQGDRFWVEMNRGKQSWVWGRMADDSVWLTLGPRRAILFSSDEIGEPLQQIADTFSLKTQSLLQDVVSHCELEYSQPDELTHRIVAVLRSGQRHRIQRAVLDVDIETKSVRRLTIKRQFADGHTSMQTFTHVESRSADESLFRPEGHLRGETQILDHRSSPDRRAEILQEIFGSAASGWLRTSN